MHASPPGPGDHQAGLSTFPGNRWGPPHDRGGDRRNNHPYLYSIGGGERSLGEPLRCPFMRRVDYVIWYVESLERSVDRPWRERTMHIADPDGNIVEYAQKLR